MLVIDWRDASYEIALRWISLYLIANKSGSTSLHELALTDIYVAIWRK